MKMNVRRPRVSFSGGAWLGSFCLAAIAMGCSAVDPGLLGDVLNGHGDGHSGGHHGGGHPPDGGPTATACSGFISSDDLYQEIAFDLASSDADDQPFIRYISLANDANARGCGEVLNLQRAALSKLVNSVSTDPRVSQPIAIDSDQTLYRIDIRDYGWDQAVTVGDINFSDGWEAIIATSPYAVPFVGDDAEDAVADSETTVPVLFGNAFVAAVSTAPLYYGLLAIPEDLDSFIRDDLGIDVAADRTDHRVVRAGLGGSGLGRDEFLAERFQIEVRSGYLWQIFSEVDGATALVDDPLGTPPAEERELLFTLPNGLLGHALADANGNRIDESNELLDTNENDFRGKVARSYFRLRPQGMTFTDELRQAVLDNPGDYSPEELAGVLDIYPDANGLDAILAGDRAVFAGALANAGGDIDAAPEPIGQTFAEFDRDVTAATAAGDLYVTPEELVNNLVLLDPELNVLRTGFVDRDDFTALYLNSLCILSIVNDNQPDPGVCD
jgi:hypothetical protein